MTSPGFRPARSAGPPCDHADDRRIDVGQHADVADLESPLRVRAHRDALFAAVAKDGQLHVAIGLGADGHAERVPRRHVARR